jgi:hypothetical protein
MNTPTEYTEPKSFGIEAAKLYNDRMKTVGTMGITHPGFRLATLPAGEETGRAVWNGPGGLLYTSHSTSTPSNPVLMHYRPNKGGYKKSHNNKNKKSRKTKTRKSKKRKL